MKNSQTINSVAYRRQMKIGRALSKCLDPKLTQRQVAAKLGLTQEGVRKIEYRALFKLAQRMRLELNEYL